MSHRISVASYQPSALIRSALKELQLLMLWERQGKSIDPRCTPCSEEEVAILEEELIPMMQFFLARTEEISQERFLSFEADVARGQKPSGCHRPESAWPASVAGFSLLTLQFT